MHTQEDASKRAEERMDIQTSLKEMEYEKSNLRDTINTMEGRIMSFRVTNNATPGVGGNEPV